MVLLKELFLEGMEPRNYYHNMKNDTWVVYHKNKYYLTCYTEEQAKLCVDLLKMCDWDTTKLKSIKRKTEVYKGSKNNKTGFHRVHIAKNKQLDKGFMYVYEYQEDNHRKKYSSKKLSWLRKKVKKNNQVWMPMTRDAEIIDKVLENMV